MVVFVWCLLGAMAVVFGVLAISEERKRKDAVRKLEAVKDTVRVLEDVRQRKDARIERLEGQCKAAEIAKEEAENLRDRAEIGFRKLSDGMKELLGIKVGLTATEMIKKGFDAGEADLAHGAKYRMFERPDTGKGLKVKTQRGQPLGATAAEAAAPLAEAVEKARGGPAPIRGARFA